EEQFNRTVVTTTDCPSSAVVGLTLTFEEGKQQRVHCARADGVSVRQAAIKIIEAIGTSLFMSLSPACIPACLNRREYSGKTGMGRGGVARRSRDVQLHWNGSAAVISFVRF